MKRNQESKSATAMRVANENEAREEPTNDQDLGFKEKFGYRERKEWRKIENGRKNRSRVATKLHSAIHKVFDIEYLEFLCSTFLSKWL